MWKNNEIVDDTYLIMNELGRGGTGVIYLAYHMRLQKYVVLKKIKDRFANVLKVRTEVDILKKLRHTYLPHVYDFMQVGDQIYTVIDYIDGCDLEKYIESGYTFQEEQLILWLRQICDVLDYLHRQKPQILHCDIKPGNIMITSDGNVCLIDFNISLDKETKSELSGISRYYASPEQYEKAMAIVYNGSCNRMIDQRTDIYSLGATFYHMISGILPAAGGDNLPLGQMELNYSPEFLQIIDKMMQPVSSRYESASAVIQALDRALRKEKAAKKFLIGVFSSAAVYAVLLVLGISLCFYGNGVANIENFNSDFSEFESYYSAGDFDRAVDLGIDMLNDSDNARLFSDRPEQKAELLHYIGECYFREERYSESCPFYRDAVDYGKNSEKITVFIRDYAIALVRCGDSTAAKEFISDAKALGLTEADLLLVEAEIFVINGEYGNAARSAERIAEKTDGEIRRRAYFVAADAYEKLGDYEAQIRCLSLATEKISSVMDMRRLGDAYIKYGESLHENADALRTHCYENAKKCYEKVLSDTYGSLSDTLNLAVIHMELDEYGEAVKLLEDVAEREESYRIQMYLAFSYDKLGDKESARKNCTTAIRLYENSSEKNKDPRDSNTIANLYLLEQKLR